jgi:hypothetical protein
MNNDIINIDSIIGNDIEVLDDNTEVESIEPLPVLEEKNTNVNSNDVISIDRLFTSEQDEKLEKEAKEEIKKEDKRIEKIQLFLIIFLVISATLVYFFGYSFFEPYIKID